MTRRFATRKRTVPADSKAHMGALPILPSAIGSWFRAKFAPGPQDRQY